MKFVNGLFVYPPHEKAPDFVKMKISMKKVEMINWLREQPDEDINIDVKESKAGKWYCSVDDWKPDPTKASTQSQQAPPAEDFDDDIPF